MSIDHLPGDSYLYSYNNSCITPNPQHSKLRYKLITFFRQLCLVITVIIRIKNIREHIAKNGWKHFTKNLNNIQNSCEELH